LRHGEPKSERLTGNKPPVAVPNKRHGGVGGCIDSVGTVYIVGFMEESQRFYEKLATANRFDERTEST
jgi:hypothetical protein